MFQPAEEAVDDRLAILFVDGFGERDGHRADLDAVLRVAAVGDAVLLHDAFETFVARHLARGVHVHQPHLRDGLRADVLIALVLRAGFETATAGHTARISVTLRDFVLTHTWPRPQIVGAVDLYPSVNALEMIEHRL